MKMTTGIIFKKDGEFDCRLGGQMLPAGSIPLAFFNFEDLTLRLIHDQATREEIKKAKISLFECLMSGEPEETNSAQVWDYENAQKVKKMTILGIYGEEGE